MQGDLQPFRSAVLGGLVLAGILLILIYVSYQARFLIVGPQITLTNDSPILQNQRAVTLEGSATNISRVWLNDRPIFTDPNGNFSTDVVLQNGYTILTLEAEDRYGRQTSLTQEFVYKPATFVTN